MPGAKHARVCDGDASEFEGEIGFDGGVDVGGATIIDVPAAVGELEREDVVDGFFLPEGVDFAVPVVVGNGVGDEGGVDDEFAYPVAFRFLFAKEVALGSFDGSFEEKVLGKLEFGVRRQRLSLLFPV